MSSTLTIDKPPFSYPMNDESMPPSSSLVKGESTIFTFDEGNIFLSQLVKGSNPKIVKVITYIWLKFIYVCVNVYSNLQ